MKLKNFSTRVLKQDCLDLPEKTYTVRYVSMTDEQRKHYTSFKEIAMTIVDDEVVSATEGYVTATTITASSVRVSTCQ